MIGQEINYSPQILHLAALDFLFLLLAAGFFAVFLVVLLLVVFFAAFLAGFLFSFYSRKYFSEN